MTVVSDVEIRLRADIARLQQDLNGARREVTGAVNGMSASVEKFKDLLGGLAVGAAVAGFAGIIKNSIDAADALNDMSARTKVAIEDLAGLSYAAKLGDTSLEGVAGAISKLGMNIGKDGAKFRELGITATEPLEAFKQLADIFKNIEDPQQRAAFGAEALGKSWQEAAVLLDGGSEGISTLVERGKELSGITEQVAADAGAFNDKIDELGFAAQGVGTRIAAGLLPTLSKIADEFSANAANSKELAGTIDVLAASLKGLYSVGIGVSALFVGLGKAIGGTMAIVAKVMSSDFKDTVATAKDVGNIYTEMFADVYGGLGDAAKRIGDLWTDTGKTVTKTAEETATATGKSAAKVAAFLNSGEIEAARKKSAADAAAAAKKEESAYAGLIASIKEKMAADQMEVDGAAAITPVQQARIKLDQELAAGKITLTAEHIKEAHALLDTAEALERNANAAKQTRAAVAALADERDKNYAALVSEADANEELVATYGKTKMEIAELTIARDEDRLSRRGELELSEDTVAQLEREIEARRRNVAAMRTVDDLDKRKAAQTEFWTSIDKTAHDTFISIANGGKDSATRLKETFKNVFFDWLYQQTIKKWIINVQGQLTTSATSGVVGAAASSLAGGGVAGSIGSAAGIAGVLGSVGSIATGALQTAGALLTGQIAIGQTLSAGLAALTSGSAAGAVAGLSSLAGALGPIALGIAGGVVLLKKAFGSGPKEVTGTSLEGMLTPTGATGNMLSTWTKKGGWFSSSKSGTDSTAFTQAQVTAFTDTYKAILDVSKMMGDAVGANTDALATRVQALRVDLTGLKTEAEQLSAVTKFFEGVADTVAAELVPNLSKFQKEGESLSTTLQRVSTNYASVDALFGAIGKTFGAVGVSSIAARERLIEAAGGLDALASGVGYFQQNFLTEAQRLAPVQKAVTEQLAAMGQSSLKTNEQFAAATLAIDTSTEAGATLFAQMLALAPSFKLVADAREAEAKTAAEAAAVIAKAQEEAAAAAKAAAEALAETNRGYQQQIDQIIAAREGEAAVRALEIAGMDASTVALYDRLKALQAEDIATKAAADAAEKAAAALQAAADKLAAINAGYQQQIDQLLAARQGEAAVRALEIAGMDASTVALYDRLAALKAEDAAIAASAKLNQDIAAAWAANYEKQQQVQQAAMQEAARAAEELATQRAAKELELYNLTHTAAEQLAHSRELELAAMAASIRPIQDQINAQKDLATAAETAAQAIKAAADKAAAVASEGAGINREMLQLQGNTAALRALELAALDPANRAAKEAVYALQDKMAADQKAAQMAEAFAQAQEQAAQEAKAAAEAIANAWRDANKSIMDEVARIRGLIGGGAASFAQAQAVFATATAQARAGDVDAAKSLAGLSQALLSLADEQAPTLLDLQRIQARTAASLLETARYTEGGAAMPASTAPAPAQTYQGYSAPVVSAPVANPAADAALAQMATRIAEQDSALDQIQRNTARFADLLEVVTEGGTAMRTNEV